MNEINVSDVSPGLNRLVAVALCDWRFRQLLLSAPEIAVEQEYNLESFRLTPEEKKMISSITADSLKEFAQQVRQRVHATNSVWATNE